LASSAAGIGAVVGDERGRTALEGEEGDFLLRKGWTWPREKREDGEKMRVGKIRG
jgi:hypothetical protein